jgi:hypothetical protein
MKYLKDYNLFTEADSFEINDTDAVDVKMSKEKFNEIKADFTEYSQKKGSIDEVFKKFKTNPTQIEAELNRILGNESENRNPFLVEYTHIAKQSYEIDKLHDENLKDKLSLDDFRRELAIAKEDTTKKAVNAKISDISNRMTVRNKKIVDIQKDIQDRDKEHKDKMLEINKNMDEYIKKISTSI